MHINDFISFSTKQQTTHLVIDQPSSKCWEKMWMEIKSFKFTKVSWENIYTILKWYEQSNPIHRHCLLHLAKISWIYLRFNWKISNQNYLIFDVLSRTFISRKYVAFFRFHFNPFHKIWIFFSFILHNFSLIL